MTKNKLKNRNSSNKILDDDIADDVSSVADSDLEGDDKEEGKADGIYGTTPKNKLNKGERKARKSLGKLGLKPVEGISKVYIKKTKQVFFVVNKPDVFKLPNSDTYVIFGEAKIEDLGAASQSEAAQRLSQMAAEASAHKDDSDIVAPESAEANELGAADGFVPTPSDIDLVIKQVGCSREEAIKSLVENKGNIVESIMQLSA